MEAVMEETMKKPDKRRYVVLAFLCLFYILVFGFTNQSFNILLATITEDMGWAAAQRTALASAMPTGMIWFVFVAGIALDKISAKKITAASGLIAGILIMLRGNATGFVFFYVLMFLFGVAAAFLQPACTKMLGLWFGQKDLIQFNGVLTTASPVGQLIANFFGVSIMGALGSWQMLFICAGIVTAVVSLACFVFVKERKSLDAELSSDQIRSKDDLKILNIFKALAKSPLFWIFIIAHCFFHGVMNASATMGQVVLQTDPGWMLDKSVSGTVPAFNNIASMIGYTVLPMFFARFGLNKYYRQIAIGTGIVSSLASYAAYQSYSFTAICTLMIITGIMYGVSIPSARMLLLQLPEVSGPRTGTAIGFCITVERLAATVFIAILGTIMAYYPDNMARNLSMMHLLQLMSPIMLFVAGFVMRHQAKKQTVSV